MAEWKKENNNKRTMIHHPVRFQWYHPSLRSGLSNSPSPKSLVQYMQCRKCWKPPPPNPPLSNPNPNPRMQQSLPKGNSARKGKMLGTHVPLMMHA